MWANPDSRPRLSRAGDSSVPVLPIMTTVFGTAPCPGPRSTRASSYPQPPIAGISGGQGPIAPEFVASLADMEAETGIITCEKRISCFELSSPFECSFIH